MRETDLGNFKNVTFMRKLFLLLSIFLLVSCEEENELDNLPEGIEGCYVEDFNGWSEGVINVDGTTFLLKNNEATNQTEQAFMFLPNGESDVTVGYMEFDENSVPTFMSFDDTQVYIQEYTDETISFTIVHADTLVYSVEDYEYNQELANVRAAKTRAWSDNNWATNAVAIGEMISGAYNTVTGATMIIGGFTTSELTLGTSLLVASAGYISAQSGITSMWSGYNKLFRDNSCYSNDPNIAQTTKDLAGNAIMIGLEKSGKLENFKTSKSTFWLDLSLMSIEAKWGKNNMKYLKLIEAYKGFHVVTGRYENVGYSSANIYGYVSPSTNIPGNITTEYGIVVYETNNEKERYSKSFFSSSEGLFSSYFKDLREDTEYSYFTYFFDKTNMIAIYGNTETFWTGHNQEREVLRALYESTNGATWTKNTNWCTDEPLDTWYGITLNDEGYVESIDLSNNSLKGEANIYGLYYLKNLDISQNELTRLTIGGEAQIDDIFLDDCMTEYGWINIENIANVTIANNSSIGTIYCANTKELEISNCNFGDNSVLSGEVKTLRISDCTMYSIDGNAQEAIVFNCDMHHCGINSEVLSFKYSSTYDTWYANTSKQLNIIESYCSTICGGDFNDNTIIHLKNATLWRSNWDEDSRVTLTCTTTGAGWYALFEH